MQTVGVSHERASDRQGLPDHEVRARRAVLAVIGITAVALAIRLAHFGESFFADELYTFKASTASSFSDVLGGVNSSLEITPPLFFIVAWLAQKVGNPFIWLRVPSLVAGVATVPLVYVLGVRTVGRRSAVVGTAFFALSPLAAFYATEARAYALLTLLVVLSTLALLRAIEGNTWPWWAAYSLLVAAAMYTHYTSVFVLAAQGIWAVIAHRERIKPLALATLGSAALFVPWLPGLAADRHAETETIIGQVFPFGWSTAKNLLLQFVAADAYGPVNNGLRHASFVLLGIAAVLGLAGLLWRLISRRIETSSEAALLVVVALAAPVGAALYSLVGDSVFLPRNLISSLPALCLAFAALLVALPRALSMVAIALAVIGLTIGTAASLRPEARRPAYADAATYVNTNAHDGDVVLEAMPHIGPSTTALRIHLNPDVAYFRMRNPREEAAALRTVRASGGRILFVRTDVRGLIDLTPPLPTNLYRVADERHWDGIYPLTVIVYEPTSQ